MRDLVLMLFVLGSIPSILLRPWLGVLMWSWLGYMNPHRMTWGFAYSFPFAQLTALATLAALLFSDEPKRMPWTGLTVVWMLFIAWMCATTALAIDPGVSVVGWEKAMKIQLFAIITLLVMRDKERIHWLIVVIALSLAFYGIKGGLFSLRRGGEFLVWGPAGSFIEDNNALALALIMTLPLMRYLQSHYENKWIKFGLGVGMLLCALSILTSHSRGAFLAGTAMALTLLFKSRYKFRMFIVLALSLPIMLASMPSHWYERMATIGTFQEDNSAMGRITAWRFAAEMAAKRPLGGGFGSFLEDNYRRYSPDIAAEIEVRDGRFQGAHSIYFRVLGEHGYIGLGLFLLLGLMGLTTAGWVSRKARGDPEWGWAADLAAMLQVSLVGFAVGGAFLGLSYFDLYYELVAVIVLLRVMVAEGLAKAAEQEKSVRHGAGRAIEATEPALVPKLTGPESAAGAGHRRAGATADLSSR